MIGNSNNNFVVMDNNTVLKMNGHSGIHTFTNASEKIKTLSNSKMSLQSLRSNSSSTVSFSKPRLNNGFPSNISLVEFEWKIVKIDLDPTYRKFGFSVTGGVDEGFPPRIDDITPDSPADRCGLMLEDEISEVNGLNVEHLTHTDIIMHIHKCKQTITLKVRRYNQTTQSEFDAHNERAIDVPNLNNNGYVTQTIAEISPQTSVDGMLKFTKRSQPRAASNAADRHSNIPSRFVNEAFTRDEFDESASLENLNEQAVEPQSIALARFVTMLELMQVKATTPQQMDDIIFLRDFLNSKRVQSAIKSHNQMIKLAVARKTSDSVRPVATNSQFLLCEVQKVLVDRNDSSLISLRECLSKPNFQELLKAHDHIAMRESLDTFPEVEVNESKFDPEQDDEESLFNNRDDDHRLKIVLIDKTDDPLGATVRNEGDAVIISRIVKGGAAEKSGLLHEGDEILEINDESVKGKDINEVVELLSELEGTLTFVLLPNLRPRQESNPGENLTVLKALFDYEPSGDEYLPCAELGLSFRKGDLLEVLQQSDPDWWQARCIDEEKQHQRLAGLIPSRSFQLKRERLKITLNGEENEPIIQEKRHCFCGQTRRKGKKVPLKSRNAPVNESEMLAYEEMVRMHPDPGRKRPVVLIGAPLVGRRELRERLISEQPDRYAAAVPHTTRVPDSGEVPGVDYTFVSKGMFEKSIAAAEFIEHGQQDGHYYGTSFSAVRSVIRSGKTCLLNMNCQTLPILKTCNLLPYVIFVTLPSITQLKRLREFDDSAEPFNPNMRLKQEQLNEILEMSRDMFRTHGHFFDKSIVNCDFETSYKQLVDICERLENEPQWVPSTWVR